MQWIEAPATSSRVSITPHKHLLVTLGLFLTRAENALTRQKPHYPGRRRDYKGIDYLQRSELKCRGLLKMV